MNQKDPLIHGLPVRVVLMFQFYKRRELDGQVIFLQWHTFRILLIWQLLQSMIMILELLSQLDHGANKLKLIHMVLETIIQINA